MVKRLFITCVLVFAVFPGRILSQQLSTIESLTPEEIGTTSVRLSSRLRSLDGSPVVVTFYLWNNYGGDCVWWQCKFQGFTGDTVISRTMAGLLPSTDYVYKSVLVTSDLNAHDGGLLEFSTLYGDRGEILLSKLIIHGTANRLRALHFGVQSYATICLDPLLGEAEQPPPPPTDIVMPRFQRSCYGQGTILDLRPYIYPSQIDTYRVRLNAAESDYPIVISWNGLDQSYSGDVKLRTSDGEIFDMKADTVCSISNPDVAIVTIIAGGPNPAANSINLITRGIMEWGASWGRLGAVIYPVEDSTRYWFEWGPTPEFGNITETVSLLSKSPINFVIDTIRGLMPGTRYYFRGSMEDSRGVIFGAQQNFVTSSVSDSRADDPVPANFSLGQNYPNPFNPTTNLEFEIPASGFVSLKVYDILGREVATLVNGFRRSGRHNIQWDAGLHPSGIYYYRLQSLGDVKTKRLLIVK